jgi:predicted RecA/RadA family phage recombinase
MKNFVQNGERVSFLESQITSKPATRIASGDPIACNRICGVANGKTTATTDTVVMSLKGVYTLPVSPVHGMVAGETVYLSASSGILSDDQTGTPFGTALASVAGGATGTIAVRLFGATPGATGLFS